MIEIIPNWHPILVHFTVALLSLSALLFVAALLAPAARWRDQCIVVAQWNLWIGTALSALTAVAGWYAFNTVKHDDLSHAAMVEHRNLAIPTLLVFVALAVWAWRNYRKARGIPTVFVLAMIAGAGLLVSTAWHGAELVYRHGLGVMSLPKTEGEGHAHQHDGGHDASESPHADDHPHDDPAQ